MKLVPIACAAALCLLASVSSAGTRTYSNADVSGGFVLSFGPQGYDDATDHVRYVGVIVTDGSGAVISGTRTAFRYEGSGRTNLSTYVQSATGTYTVQPDGTGTMSLTWTPALPGEPFNAGTFPGAEACSRNVWEPEETLHLAVTYDGFRFVNEQRHTYVRDCPAPFTDGNGVRPLTPITVPGTATRQEALPVQPPSLVRAPQTRAQR